MISYLLKYLPHDNIYRLLFVERDLSEVIASQNKMLERRGEQNQLPDDEARRILDEHVQKTKRWVAGRDNVEMFAIQYADVIGTPLQWAREIEAFLGRDLGVEEMADAVEPSLDRNRLTSR